MTHDYLADENGEFEMVFSEYNTDKIISHVYVKGLKPFQCIATDLIKEGSR